jgi:hypothetical protein
MQAVVLHSFNCMEYPMVVLGTDCSRAQLLGIQRG